MLRSLNLDSTSESRTRSLAYALSASGLSAVLGFWSGRLHGLTLDESVTLHWTFLGFHQGFRLLFEEIHTPSYEIFLGTWLYLTKFDVFYARLFSALLAALSVGASYVLTARFFGKRAAYLAAALIALSPLHVYYSGYARAYALQMAAATLSSYSYLSFRQRPRPGVIALYLTSSYLLISSHIVGFTLLAAQSAPIILSAIANRKMAELRRWGAMQLGLILLYLPILFVILKRYSWIDDIPKIYFWVPLPKAASLLSAFRYLSGDSTSMAAVFFFLLCLLPFFAAKSGSRIQPGFPKLKWYDEPAFYLLTWLLLPAAVLFSYSYIHHPVFILRGLALSAPPLLILSAYSAATVVKRGSFFVFVSIALCALSSSVTADRKFGEPEDWDEAARIVNKNPAAAVLINPDFSALPFAYYFEPRCFYSIDWQACLKNVGAFSVNRAEEIKPLLKPGATVFYLGYNVVRERNDAIVQDLIESKRVRLLSKQSLQSIEVSRFLVSGYSPIQVTGK